MTKSLVGLLAVPLLLVVVAPTSSAKKGDCGNCPLQSLGWGAPSGAYRFDTGNDNDIDIPEHLQQATFWADDSWGANYHDQNNPNATTIALEAMPPTSYGRYDGNNNVLYVNSYHVDRCTSACNVLISVVSHEFGHTVGIDDFYSGCESSIMSHERDRTAVIGPSEEDECWFMGGGLGGGWECPELPCVPYDRSGKTPPGLGGVSGRGGRGGGGTALKPALTRATLQARSGMTSERPLRCAAAPSM